MLLNVFCVHFQSYGLPQGHSFINNSPIYEQTLQICVQERNQTADFSKRIECSTGDPISVNSTRGHETFYVATIRPQINDLEAAHNVEMIFPKLLEGKVCSFGHVKA